MCQGLFSFSRNNNIKFKFGDLVYIGSRVGSHFPYHVNAVIASTRDQGSIYPEPHYGVRIQHDGEFVAWYPESALTLVSRAPRCNMGLEKHRYFYSNAKKRALDKEEWLKTAPIDVRQRYCERRARRSHETEARVPGSGVDVLNAWIVLEMLDLLVKEEAEKTIAALDAWYDNPDKERNEDLTTL